MEKQYKWNLKVIRDKELEGLNQLDQTQINIKRILKIKISNKIMVNIIKKHQMGKNLINIENLLELCKILKILK